MDALVGFLVDIVALRTASPSCWACRDGSSRMSCCTQHDARIQNHGADTCAVGLPAQHRCRIHHGHCAAHRRRMDSAVMDGRSRPSRHRHELEDDMISRSTGVAVERHGTRSVRKLAPALGQIVLVLQGGGALGAYQAGVYQALHEAGIEPDWIVGTSIGAINASLIAGNTPRKRVPALEAFWDRMAAEDDLGRLGRLAATLPSVVLLEHLDPRYLWLFRAQPTGVLGDACFAGRRPSRLLLDRAAREDAAGARRLPARPPLQAPPHGRCRARAHEPDALLRQLRRGDRGQAHHGFGRLAAGLPGGAHRRRALLGRRHPFQHANRGDFRRQSASQLADLCRAPVEPHRP